MLTKRIPFAKLLSTIFVALSIFYSETVGTAQEDEGGARSGVVIVFGENEAFTEEELTLYDDAVPVEWIIEADTLPRYELMIFPSVQRRGTCDYGYSRNSLTRIPKFRRRIMVIIADLVNEERLAIARSVFDGDDPGCPFQVNLLDRESSFYGSLPVVSLVAEWIYDELADLPDVASVRGDTAAVSFDLSAIEFEEVQQPDFRVGDGDHIVDASFNPRSTRIIIGSRWRIEVWDAISKEVIEPNVCGESGRVRSVSYNPDGDRILLVQGSTVGILRTEGRCEFYMRLLNENVALATRTAQYSSDGRYVLIYEQDRNASLWRAILGMELVAISGARDLQTAALSPAADVIATGSRLGTLQLWNAESSDEVDSLEWSSGINSIDFSPDGTRLVLAGEDGQIAILAVDTLEILLQFQGHEDTVNHVRFSPDGTKIVSASDDTTVRLWNAETGDELRRFTGHTDVVNVANFSPNGRLIVSGGAENGASVWSVPYGDGN